MEEDSDLNQKPRAKSTLDSPNNNGAFQGSPVASIHENVLSFLLSCNILKSQPLEKTGNKTECESGNSLQLLRQKRIYLASEIASIRSQSALSTITSEEPGQTKKIIAIQTSSFLEETASSLEALWESEETDDRNQLRPSANLAVSMQRFRKKRKLDAAYRLGGITAAVPYSDPELLSIRFDICLDGEYVACYHAFFDLIVAEAKKDAEDNKEKQDEASDNKQAAADAIPSPEPKLFLRLVQHTIPSSVPLQDICRQTLGGALFQLGDLRHSEDWQTQEFQTRIRSWCRQCYRACWCLARRKQAWNFLEQLRQESLKDKGNETIVNSLTTNSATDGLDQISFQLSLYYQSTASEDHQVLDVQLNYGDPMRSQPTQAKVKVVPRSLLPSSGGLQQSRCDEDTEKNRELAKRAQKAFLELPMDEALEQLKGNHSVSTSS